MGMLGLCARAGKLASGEEAVRIALKKKQAHLVVIDREISSGSAEKYERMAANADVELIGAYSQIGRAIGKESRMALAVTDEGFAKALRRIHTADQE